VVVTHMQVPTNCIAPSSYL